MRKPRPEPHVATISVQAWWGATSAPHQASFLCSDRSGETNFMSKGSEETNCRPAVRSYRADRAIVVRNTFRGFSALHCSRPKRSPLKFTNRFSALNRETANDDEVWYSASSDVHGKAFLEYRNSFRIAHRHGGTMSEEFIGLGA
eukprot:5058270-Amphidinium_carterae.1